VKKKQTWEEKLSILDMQEADLKLKMEQLETQKSEAFKKFREVLAVEDAKNKATEKALKAEQATAQVWIRQPVT